MAPPARGYPPLAIAPSATLEFSYETRVKSPPRSGAASKAMANLEITGVAGMEHAGPGHLTFLANPKYAPKVKHTQGSAILVTQPLAGSADRLLWFRTNPYLDFARALALFYQPPRPAAGDSSAGLRRAHAPRSGRTVRSDRSPWSGSGCGSEETPCCIRTS